MKPYYKNNGFHLYLGDAVEVLKNLESDSVHCIVTSPPYYGLRDYGTKGQIGLESTPAEYVERLVDVFREAKRVLRSDGTVWLNLGDSYIGNGTGSNKQGSSALGGGKSTQEEAAKRPNKKPHAKLKTKDLIGIPWRVAFALQDDGWYLRQEIIWCLSGGTLIYARTQKGDSAMTIKDLFRLDPSTVKLWNGEKWTQLLGMSRSERNGDELEVVLRSGERISCTPTHKFPTGRGLLEAGEIAIGDTIDTCILPEPTNAKDCALDEDAAWFAGLYIADGSRSGDTIQITGHSKKEYRWERIRKISTKYGGSCTRTIDGNSMHIRVYGKILNAIINEFVTGKVAINKGFAPVVWNYSNSFISSMIDGYLSADGHWDGSRWRLGFCRNYNLERDLRVACARLGYKLTLNLAHTMYDGKNVPTFRGEIRKHSSGHWNEKKRNTVVEIRNARCRHVYDIGVEDDPHLFSLASGTLTHNSKRNPMPESVKDRCTKSHEQIFLLSQSERYYFDNEAIKEPAKYPDGANSPQSIKSPHGQGFTRKACSFKRTTATEGKPGNANQHREDREDVEYSGTRNKRSVWTVSTRPYKGAHFATFPPDIPEICIKAGCPKGGTVMDIFNGAGTTGMVAREQGMEYRGIDISKDYLDMTVKRAVASLDQISIDD